MSELTANANRSPGIVVGVGVGEMTGVEVKSGVEVLLGVGITVGVEVLNSSVSTFAGEKNTQAVERQSKIASSSRGACAFRPGLILLGNPDHVLHEEGR